jgi:prephenate dehydratase
LDAEGSITDEGVKRAIEAVQNQCQFSKFLGSYKKGVVA